MTEMTKLRQIGQKTVLLTTCGLLLSLCWVSANAQTPTPQVLSLPQAKGATPTQSKPASQAWQQLTPRQKQALAPLGAQWGALTGQQQSKWLALSQNFAQLSVSEQITLHARMADWVALSRQQRTLARLNFNKLQNLPIEDKKAKWEAYKALSAEERRLLSGSTGAPAKSAALTAKPLDAHRIVQTPMRAEGILSRTPSTDLNRKTLLPRPPTVATPASISPISPVTNTSQQANEIAPS